jgi:hypothetical protein
VPGDTIGSQDIFVRDLQTNTTKLISVDRNGNQANGQKNGSVAAHRSAPPPPVTMPWDN